MSLFAARRLRRRRLLAMRTDVAGVTRNHLAAGPVAHDFVERVYRDRDGAHKYTVFVPANYSADKKWPVILYLHGASTRG